MDLISINGTTLKLDVEHAHGTVCICLNEPSEYWYLKNYHFAFLNVQEAKELVKEIYSGQATCWGDLDFKYENHQIIINDVVFNPQATELFFRWVVDLAKSAELYYTGVKMVQTYERRIAKINKYIPIKRLQIKSKLSK